MFSGNKAQNVSAYQIQTQAEIQVHCLYGETLIYNQGNNGYFCIPCSKGLYSYVTGDGEVSQCSICPTGMSCDGAQEKMHLLP